MTTIVLVRKNNEVVVAGDGQVSMGNTVVKSTASKIRKIEKRDVVAGFAKPATTSLFSIFLIFEAVLFTTVFPILTCPSPATTTSLFFLTSTIVVMLNKW